jgi:hypothetical protein
MNIKNNKIILIICCCSNKSPTRWNNFSVHYPDVYLQLNILRANFEDCNRFKVCKSVHHRTIQIDHHPDAAIFQFIILTFIYSSTCYGRSPAHHQELNDCSSSLWFYLRIVGIAVLCSWSGRSGPTTNTARLSPRYEGKIRGCCCCSYWAPDDGRENARNMLNCK